MRYEIVFIQYMDERVINQTVIACFYDLNRAYEVAKTISEALCFKEGIGHDELVDGRTYGWLEVMPNDYERAIKIVPVFN